MNILGISAGFHDAAATVISPQGEILFAAHSERYSKIKNDANISAALLQDLSQYDIGRVAYYERPLIRQLRQCYAGQGLEWNRMRTRSIVDQQTQGQYRNVPVRSFNHHLSHAAGGFQTSPYQKATVVVIDAVGEWDTVSIWAAEYLQGQAHYRRLWRQWYPHSLGLFYSAVTAQVGLRPMDEEYILMGMAAYGHSVHTGHRLRLDLVQSEWDSSFKHNLHTGLSQNYLDHYDAVDLAAGAQDLLEDLISNIMTRARSFGWSKNLVYTGGVALNCLANRLLGNWFDSIWIMPNPGDAGSSLGAAALMHGGALNWHTAYLGHDIPGPYPTDAVLEHLLTKQIAAVSSGRAEFGPRALGNRSLLADPRGPDIKDQVNAIKRRQKFRPFAPVILEEMADQYFDFSPGWRTSRYMQSVARCRYPDRYPAICHVDGTSRVQTVPRDGSGIRALLEKWYQVTNCPILLNTSLNIRGEAMVNDRSDADRFTTLYGVEVLS